jgi:serine/threonine protein kinase
MIPIDLPFPGFSVLHTIGVGTFSIVHLAEQTETKAKIAVKVIRKDSDPRNTNEIEVMHGINFPFICRMFASGEDQHSLYVAEELASGGSLLSLVARTGKLCSYALRQLTGQLLLALEFLHQQKRIIHLDIKTENILLDRYNTIKLTDFGLATFDGETGQFCGSGPYIAPELIRHEKPGCEADLWSFGIVLYCCAVGQFPFYDSFLGDLFVKILTLEPDYPSDLEPDLRDLIHSLLKKDPSERISLSGMRKHPFLAGFDFGLFESLSQIPVASERMSISEMVNAREKELDRYQQFGILEKTDGNKTDERALEATLAAMDPTEVARPGDPMAALAKRTAKGRRGQRAKPV